MSYHNDLRKLVLGDLGHAKHINESKSRSGVAFGTDCYIAPEIIDERYDTSPAGSRPEQNTKLDIWFVNWLSLFQQNERFERINWLKNLTTKGRLAACSTK